MGYDYHWSGSQPGASSPVDRIDGVYDLRWSIDRYVRPGSRATGSCSACRCTG